MIVDAFKLYTFRFTFNQIMHICRFARRRLVALNLISCSFGPTVTSPLSAAESSVLGNGSETTDVFVD